jgi:deoxycytidine triphosphate deaminase
MSLLRDEELKALVDAHVIDGFDAQADWYNKSSPVQPASVDLHIGGILVPGVSPGLRGSIEKPFLTYVLGPGQTAIASIKEKLTIPKDLAAIGFPPAHVSLGGILTTNPGHIDPGFVGHLHLTLINMSRDQHVLQEGSVILTLLFFRLNGVPKADYTTRAGPQSREGVAFALERLSKDFLDLEQRTERIAAKAAKAEGLRSLSWQRFYQLFGLVLTLGALSGGVSIAFKLAVVEQQQQISDERRKLQDTEKSFDERLSKLEAQSTRKSTIQASAKP